jgi:hypothetical protein
LALQYEATGRIVAGQYKVAGRDGQTVWQRKLAKEALAQSRKEDRRGGKNKKG